MTSYNQADKALLLATDCVAFTACTVPYTIQLKVLSKQAYTGSLMAQAAAFAEVLNNLVLMVLQWLLCCTKADWGTNHPYQDI